MKNLVVLGSTGSIGRQTLAVVRRFPQEFRVIALAGATNASLLAEQITEFKPRYVYCQSAITLPPGIVHADDLTQLAVLDKADIVVAATPGYSGLAPVLAAAGSGKVIALANKESLVAAGALIKTTAAESGARLHPVDSEHSAIWQCLAGETSLPRKIILTASGGPFREYSAAEMKKITVEQALAHPSWNMGPKVTVDSATLVNKGLETIEAHWLFDIPYDRIQVLIHPQSIIHSMVEFEDGAIKAQLGVPDMRLPIQYALTHPERWENSDLPQLDFGTIRTFDFAAPDESRFPGLALARQAGRLGGTYPAVFCAADEIAVGAFLEHRIGFTFIPELIGRVMDNHRPESILNLEAIQAADARARQVALSIISKEKHIGS